MADWHSLQTTAVIGRGASNTPYKQEVAGCPALPTIYATGGVFSRWLLASLAANLKISPASVVDPDSTTIVSPTAALPA